MQFVFFSAADTPLFVRSDAEQATWTVEEMSLVAVFPYKPGMILQRGQRVGFTDETGVFQPFEIRKVETMLPDHYQRITAEHIVISELTDEHYAGANLTNVTAQAALAGLLTGTLWQVGTVTASGTQTADMSLGSVWQNVRTIEQNWNVYITPRVTFNTSGITGRYLDIAPAQGTWRGVRLSLDKNADEIGVVIDDTNVITAIYGYGALTGEGEQRAPLTFEDVVWQQTSDHPAKPSGQTYLEDPAATAAYGRNGRPRYGYYQNTDINDANVLLEKAWESLKVNSAPMVSINCMVRDLYRLGYKDQPIRLHDTAMVELRQTGTDLQLEIIKLTVDLLDPTATRPTIGTYIPNIVYMMRQTAQEATGGVASTASGSRGTKRGGGGKSANDNKRSEFATEIKQNQYQISLRAYQTDMTEAQNILRAAGISINAQGVLIYATDNENMLGSRFNVTADEITAEVTRATAAEGTMSSRITQTADAITAEVTRATAAETEAYSRITQTADAITAEVTRATAAEGTMSSRITQTADAITAEVTRATTAEGSLGSRITQTADAINLEVSKKVGNNEIISRINQTAESILIQASKINLSGYVTASQFNALSGSFNNLVSGTTSASKLTASNGNFSNLEITNALTYGGYGDLKKKIINALSSSASGGTITISSTTLDGSAGPSVNFNIADTQYYRNAVASAETDGWNAARAKVAPPSAGTETSFTVDVPSATQGEKQTYTFTIQKGATPGTSGYASVALGQSVVGRISIGDWYSAGYSAGFTAGQTAGEAYGYTQGWNAAEAQYSAASYARKNLNRYGHAELYVKERETYYSAGNHYWYWSGSDGWDTLYTKSSS